MMTIRFTAGADINRPRDVLFLLSTARRSANWSFETGFTTLFGHYELRRRLLPLKRLSGRRKNRNKEIMRSFANERTRTEGYASLSMWRRRQSELKVTKNE